ncbi:CoA transferase [Burkholderia multivorans]|uniref:CoA transferase n=1 Tax=Burkholderia multivorans TaxID=87883 RepID=UPI003D2E0236
MDAARKRHQHADFGDSRAGATRPADDARRQHRPLHRAREQLSERGRARTSISRQARTACSRAWSKRWISLRCSPDERFSTQHARLRNADAINAIVAAWVGRHTAHDVVAAMDRVGVPCAKVATLDEVVSNPQLIARKQIVDIEHPVRGTLFDAWRDRVAVRDAWRDSPSAAARRRAYGRSAARLGHRMRQ